MTPEEFHQRYDGIKPYYEYWFGEAVQKPRANTLHSATQFAAALALDARGWHPALEVTLKIVPGAEPIPDVIATRGKRLKQPYPNEPVDLCVEILSPEDQLDKVVAKGKHYLQWGIPIVWIVDPENREAWIITATQPGIIHVSPDGSLTAADAEIPLREIFDEVDRGFAEIG